MTAESKELDGMDIFTDEQLDRLDQIQDAAYDFIKVIAEADDIPRDLNLIWELIYTAADALTDINGEHKRHVRIPTHVTLKDGTEYTTDWYEVEDSQKI